MVTGLLQTTKSESGIKSFFSEINGLRYVCNGLCTLNWHYHYALSVASWQIRRVCGMCICMVCLLSPIMYSKVSLFSVLFSQCVNQNTCRADCIQYCRHSWRSFFDTGKKVLTGLSKSELINTIHSIQQYLVSTHRGLLLFITSILASLS